MILLERLRGEEVNSEDLRMTPEGSGGLIFARYLRVGRIDGLGVAERPPTILPMEVGSNDVNPSIFQDRST